MLDIHRHNFLLFINSESSAISSGYFQRDDFYNAVISDDQNFIKHYLSDILIDYSHVQRVEILNSDSKYLKRSYRVHSDENLLFADFRINDDYGNLTVPDKVIKVTYNIHKILDDLQNVRNFSFSDDGIDFLYGLNVSYNKPKIFLFQFVSAITIGLFNTLLFLFLTSKSNNFFYQTEGLEKIIYLFEKTEEYSANHSRRVAMISNLIATELGFRGRRLRDIKVAAYLHDIGKISIPVEILNKKGKLEKDEFGIVQQHVVYSAEIVSNFKELAHLRDIVYYHHEKIDGSGYPEGLKGEDIPKESRILAIADIFEALTGIRPYRAPMSANEAISIMEGMSLDSILLDVLKRNIDSATRIVKLDRIS